MPVGPPGTTGHPGAEGPKGQKGSAGKFDFLSLNLMFSRNCIGCDI